MNNIFSKKNTGHYELLTETGEEFLKEKCEPWQEYPRPQMRRKEYQILNGEWSLNGHMTVVPFPPQSRLSGYNGEINDTLVYEKKFTLDDALSSEKSTSKETPDETGKRSGKKACDRILLHFGAVDQVAKVWVNDTLVGEHEGGYLPFYFDITDALCDGENKIRVQAVDTLSHDYPYGKQRKKRGGMWYTPVSGIWQTVWLERVPADYIEKVKLTPDLNGVDIEIYPVSSASVANKTNTVNETDIENKTNAENKISDTDSARFSNDEQHTTEIKSFTISLVLDNGQKVKQQFSGLKGRICLSDILLEDGSRYVPKLWTPETPYLYSMTIKMEDDVVETYFALRTINIEETDSGKRVCLNGKSVFLHGVLDQGYFPEGIYLPAKAKEFETDILRMKELGINMLRKHIKVEPEAFYYACDRLGMLVMQDMVNNGPYSFVFDTALPTIGLKKRPDRFLWEKGFHDTKDILPEIDKIKNKRKAFFIKHSKETIEHLYNHPSIIAYTIFNEGWGQFHSDKLYDMVKEWDPTRLADSTSGWFAQKKNDFDSEHVYFKVIPLQVKKRPLFVSECGGYSMVVEGHHYSKDNEYGYGACRNAEELTDKIIYMYENMIQPFIKDGLCGCVYTQLSDVEDEVNGLYTYDRRVCKVDKARMKELADRMQQSC